MPDTQNCCRAFFSPEVSLEVRLSLACVEGDRRGTTEKDRAGRGEGIKRERRVEGKGREE